jgi:hypothetical protein
MSAMILVMYSLSIVEITTGGITNQVRIIMVASNVMSKRSINL